MTHEMRVWIGCLACYNAGDLVGEWFPADEAGEVSRGDVHRNVSAPAAIMRMILDTHEEMWVMDHEGLPVSGEMSPHEAQAWADLMGEVDDDERPAFAAYIDALGHNDPADISADDFREAYSGEWDSREDFAQDLAEEMGAIPTDYSWPASYVDWERAARDLFMDYTDAPAPGGRIYVFRGM